MHRTRNDHWTRNDPKPGSVKRVYRAQHPLLLKQNSILSNSSVVQNFENYESSVSNVCDAALLVDDTLVMSSAAKVLERHAAGQLEDDPFNNVNGENALMPNCYSALSNHKAQALQRLSTQKDMNDISRIDRLRRILGLRHFQGGQPAPGTIVDIDELRKVCWLGIPHKIRPLAWRILSGYISTNLDRRNVILKRKRDEYWRLVGNYFGTRFDEQYRITFRQIQIDIPRMCPLIPLFQQKKVQEIFERILYIWAIQHPASGYVQGMNDLVTPFFIVYLSEFIPDDTDLGNFKVDTLSREQLELIEADSFWCVSGLLRTIQDNYTVAQPGIQRKVNDLKELISRVEKNLYLHFEANGVEFLQFSFRWMNNLLMREISLRATIRLWDTYLCEEDGFSQFHTYVCGAFLRLWSKQLQNEKDFQDIMLMLQSLPTQRWNDQQICELTADAYSLMQFFHGAKSHLQN